VTASSGSLADSLVDSATGYRFLRVCGRDIEIERSEVSPGLSEMYKIHLACFSGIDVERVTIYVSPFLHGEKRKRDDGETVTPRKP